MNNIKTNFAPGLVVFLVALPLCLGIALASGAPPLSGIIAGVIGGVVVGAISNSHLSVSGPAAGLTAIVLAAIASLGSFQLFLLAGLLAGVIQLCLGFFRAGSISNYVPNNVIEGMLAGIGIIIIKKQIPHALGYDVENMAKEENIIEPGFDFSIYFNKLFASVHLGVIIIFLISITILILWDKFKLQQKLKLLPGALVAVTVSILLSQFVLSRFSNLNIQNEHLVQLPVLSSIANIQALIILPDFSGITQVKVWITAFTIAIVASIETLLCIEAADKMDKAKRITDTNLELKAQGIGNITSALLGGLPMTSVVVRTSANASAGATHKTATIIHGLLLLICFLLIPSVLNKIPLSTLAAVLILVGYKLAKPAVFKHFWHKGKYQFIPFVATVIAVVALDLLKGVSLGLIISFIFVLRENLKRSYYLNRKELAEADEITITLAEEVSFLNKAAIKKTLKNIVPGSKVIIDASHCTYIAADVVDLIEDFTNYRAKEDNITVELKGLKTNLSNKITSSHSHIEITHKRTI
jgi:MFS superfamily sulfate permease-like transporter